MKSTKRSLYRLSIVAVAFVSVIGLGALMIGEPGSKRLTRNAAPAGRHNGAVEDWSSHHLVYSNPGTHDQVRSNPAAYSRWLDIQYDTRYIMQQMRRGVWRASASSLSS